jgi:nitrite reductase (NADH) large subunit
VSEPLVIIGNGMAAARFTEELAKRALGRYAVAVIGDEPRLAYNRVLLSSVLAGEIASKDIELKSGIWWRDHGVTLTYGCAATSIDKDSRVVHLANGTSVPYAKLVIATGSSALRLNVPGSDLDGVHTFRDSRDVDILLGLARDKKRVVVVGGGLLGLEAAYGLAKAGSKVTLLHLMDRLMERQLDMEAAAVLKQRVEEKGVEVLLKASTANIIGTERVEGVALADGRTIAADAVIFAAGIRVVSTNLKVSGVSVFSAGDFDERDGSETMTFRDVRRGTYKKLMIADGRLTGAVLVGDTQDALWYLDLIRTQKPVATMRHDMMFGRALAEPKAA